MATLGKPQRQHRILRILEEQPVSSQAQLVQLLEAEGVVATQATVSRDLEELGAVKVRIPGGTMAYAIPDYTRGERAPSDDHLKRLMSEFVSRSRTAPTSSCCARRPGSAHVVGVALDRRRLARHPRHGRRRRHVVLVVHGAVGGAARRRRPRRPRRPVERRAIVTQASCARVLGRARHVDRGAVDARGLGRRGRRVRGRRRPAEAGRRPTRSTNAARGRGRGRGRGHRRPRTSSRDDFLVPALAGQRAVRGQVPARLGAVAPGDRRAPRRVRPPAPAPTPSRTAAPARATTRCGSRCRRGSSRPTSTCSRRCACGAHPRRLHRARRRSGRSRSRRPSEKLYSIDENMWGRAIECGVLENPWASPPEEPFTLTR